jgi:hypothetical protein
MPVGALAINHDVDGMTTTHCFVYRPAEGGVL